MIQTRDDLLTVKEAAAFLKVSPFTIYRWVGSGRLRAVRPSPRLIRLRRADVESLGSDADPVLYTRRAIREAEARPLYDEHGEPRRGSPMAVLTTAGMLKDDEEFARAMDEVLRERHGETIKEEDDVWPDSRKKTVTDEQTAKDIEEFMGVYDRSVKSKPKTRRGRASALRRMLAKVSKEAGEELMSSLTEVKRRDSAFQAQRSPSLQRSARSGS